MKSWIQFLVLGISFSVITITHAEIMNVLVAKEIDDNHIIVVTAKGDQLLLEKWSLMFSPLSFEGKVFPADVSPMWLRMFIEDKGEIKWSIEKHLGTVELEKSKEPAQHSAPKAPNQEGYTIEVAHNDELFIINGEKYEAKTYCLYWEQGEHVLFIEGSEFGACVSAKLLNIERGEVCEVWCE
jgi:hypothetical protein